MECHYYHNQAVFGTDDTGPGFVEVEPGIWESVHTGLAGLFGIPDSPYNWTSTYTQEDIAGILECENAEWCSDYRTLRQRGKASGALAWLETATAENYEYQKWHLDDAHPNMAILNHISTGIVRLSQDKPAFIYPKFQHIYYGPTIL